MENEVQIFENNGRGISLPVKEVGGQVYFEAEAAAIGLGITTEVNGDTYVRWPRINSYLGFATSGKKIKKGDWITEPQFYKLAFKASNDVAEKFQDWVASEVLPSIRKHGAYATPETIESILANPDNGIKLLQALKDERSQKEQALLEASKEREARAIAEQKLSEAKPKLDYVDKILESKKTILTTHLATDYGCSAVAFNRMLCDKKIQRKVRDTYVLYSQYQGHGWTHTFARAIKTKHGQEIKEQMEWTQKGNIGLYELLKDRFGLLPEIERDYSKPHKIVTTKGKIEEVF